MSSVFTMHSLAGFCSAPVSKGLISIMVAGSGIIHLPPSTIKNLNIHSYISTNEIYFVRLIMQRLFFWNLKDLMCGCLLLYYFRIFERRYGSTKYASTLFANFVISQTLHYALVYLAHNLLHYDIGPVPRGPYGMVLSQFVPYFTEIPSVAYTEIFNIFPVTGKTLTYLIALQIMSPSSSIMIAALSGIISSLLYRRNILYVQSWLRMPSFLSRACSWLFLSDDGRAVEQESMPATVEMQRQQQMEQLEQRLAYAYQQQQEQPQAGPGLRRARRQRQRPAAGAGGGGIWARLFSRGQRDQADEEYPQANGANINRRQVQPSEENINRLLEMGFSCRDSINRALIESNNDVTLATNILLQQGTTSGVTANDVSAEEGRERTTES